MLKGTIPRLVRLFTQSCRKRRSAAFRESAWLVSSKPPVGSEAPNFGTGTEACGRPVVLHGSGAPAATPLGLSKRVLGKLGLIWKESNSSTEVVEPL
jgi:hypothetical protein